MAWLALARLLVARIKFERWRRTLGSVANGPTVPPGSPTPDRVSAMLASAIDRGAARLPGASRCLPQAMALTWMLRIRGKSSSLHLGVGPTEQGGSLDDLHAWVERDGRILIGDSVEAYHAVLTLKNSGRD